MFVSRLDIVGLRNLDVTELPLSPGLNLFQGANGAGKTTVVEALFMLGHGRSFRARNHTDLVAYNRKQATIFCQLQADHRTHQLGLQRDASGTVVKIDGESASLADAGRLLPLRLFEPNSHELIDGAAGGRRQFLDWGVFHVEHSFLAGWRRYQAAVRHRNAQLRKGASDRELSAFEPELARLASQITEQRRNYIEQLVPVFASVVEGLTSKLDVNLKFYQGWGEGQSLADRLAQGRVEDRNRGHMISGAHRADLKVIDEHGTVVRRYSRGQTKVVALALVLAQLQLHTTLTGKKAVLCLDDVAAELDGLHQQRLFSWLDNERPQVFATSVNRPEQLDAWTGEVAVFHVEHGKIRAA
ncbi:MAG: DNA replication and repair protein RecF [Lysobacteraceae bacterium]|nr:MAG: DNA replication and repair protein RecF [Xanthomonadaceae bacterium]